LTHYCAYGCDNQSKKRKVTGQDERKVTFYQIPADQELRKKWIFAIGRPMDNLPRFLHLCSEHFHPSCFDESIELKNKFIGGTK